MSNPTVTIAIVEGGTAKLLRPSKRGGAEQFAAVVLPSADPDEIARTVFALVEALTPHPAPEVLTPHPAPAAVKKPRKHGRNRGHVQIRSADIVAVLAEKGAIDENSAMAEDDVVRLVATRANVSPDAVRKRITVLGATSVGVLAWKTNGVPRGPGRIKTVWLANPPVPADTAGV